jgi:hypothetical protein
MRTAEIRYRQLLFVRRHLRMKVPTEVAEMSPRQFVAAVSLSKGWIDSVQYFTDFFGIPRRLLMRIDDYYLFRLAGMLDTLTVSTDVPCPLFLIPSLDGGLVAPAAKLKGMSFEQFMAADTFFSWFAFAEKEVYLNKMIASLYLRDGEDFFSLDMDRRTTEVARLPLNIRYAVAVNWSLVKSWLGEAYPYLFPKSEMKGTDKKRRPGSWLALFDTVVGDNMPDVERYKRMQCMDALRMLNRRIKDNKNR